MLEDLKKIEFHDLPVKSLLLDFANNCIGLVVKDYDEIRQDYLEINLLFTSISSFYFQNIDQTAMSEIYNCILKEDGQTNFIEFTMISSTPIISCVVSFHFKEVRLEYNANMDW